MALWWAVIRDSLIFSEAILCQEYLSLVQLNWSDAPLAALLHRPKDLRATIVVQYFTAPF